MINQLNEKEENQSIQEVLNVLEIDKEELIKTIHQLNNLIEIFSYKK